MANAAAVSGERRVRRWRSVSEKRQIVQLTLEPVASVAEVARAHGVNANLVFTWRRAFERGELATSSTAPIPVTVSSEHSIATEDVPLASCRSAIHTELPGRALISVETGADPSISTVDPRESAQLIQLPAGTKTDATRLWP